MNYNITTKEVKNENSVVVVVVVVVVGNIV